MHHLAAPVLFKRAADALKVSKDETLRRPTAASQRASAQKAGNVDASPDQLYSATNPLWAAMLAHCVLEIEKFDPGFWAISTLGIGVNVRMAM